MARGNWERRLVNTLPLKERKLGKRIGARKLCEEIGRGGITPSPWSSPVKGEEIRNQGEEIRNQGVM